MQPQPERAVFAIARTGTEFRSGADPRREPTGVPRSRSDVRLPLEWDRPSEMPADCLSMYCRAPVSRPATAKRVPQQAGPFLKTNSRVPRLASASGDFALRIFYTRPAHAPIAALPPP